MDQKDSFSSQKSEPSLDADDAFSTAPPVAAPTESPVEADSPETGDMPAWLNKPGEDVPVASGWRRTGLWVGGLALVIAAGAAGTHWLLKQYEASSVAQIRDPGTQTEALTPVTQKQPSAAELPVIPPKPADALPPLVLLPPEQGGKPKAPPEPASPAGVPVSEAAGAVAPAAPAPVAAKPADKVVPDAVTPPVGAKPAAKPAIKAGARPAGAAAAKKKAAAAKRAAGKPVRGTTLPPPRSREREANDEQREASPARRCIPGELARECEARLKQR